MRKAALLFTITGAIVAGATPARASKNQVMVIPDFANPALPDRLVSEFSGVSYQVICPDIPADADESTVYRLERRIEVTVGNDSDSYRDPSIAAGLIEEARAKAWSECPVSYVDFVGGTHLYFDIGSVTVYRRTRSPDTLLLEMGGYHVSGFDLTWDRWAEHEADRADEAAAAAKAQQDQAEAEEQEQAEAAAEAQRIAYQRQQEEEAQKSAESTDRFFSGLWFWTKFAFFVGIAAWLFSQREAILEWYYSLFSHPAQDMVDDAIYHGTPIDGDLYAQIHEPAFSNQAENVVRMRQADELTRRLRQHERALREEEERQLEKARERVDRENAFVRAHTELLRAGIDHEVAAASLDQLRKATRHDEF